LDATSCRPRRRQVAFDFAHGEMNFGLESAGRRRAAITARRAYSRIGRTATASGTDSQTNQYLKREQQRQRQARARQARRSPAADQKAASKADLRECRCRVDAAQTAGPTPWSLGKHRGGIALDTDRRWPPGRRRTAQRQRPASHWQRSAVHCRRADPGAEDKPVARWRPQKQSVVAAHSLPRRDWTRRNIRPMPGRPRENSLTEQRASAAPDGRPARDLWRECTTPASPWRGYSSCNASISRRPRDRVSGA
jgi:hypothetical protein